MKTIIFIILISASLCSCGQTKNTSLTKGNDDTSGIQEMDATIADSIPDNLKKIVQKIAAINEVQEQYVGFAGTESENYKNFLELKKAATTEELVSLTKDTNNVVACYAAWALADMSYPGLPGIFTYFLEAHKRVNTFSGCIRSNYDGSVDFITGIGLFKFNDGLKSTDKLYYNC